MMKTKKMLLCLLCWLTLGVHAVGGTALAGGSWADDEPPFGEENNLGAVSDPLEPLNRVFYHFNDRLYFWALKPLAQGYSYFIADDIRMCVRDFFRNLGAPVRMVNNLLQGKVEAFGVETARFLVNSTIGMVGLTDPAKSEFGLLPVEEDLGQTLGFYGVGEGIYLCLPFFGPSNLRDAVGLAGDAFLAPSTYVGMSDSGAGIAMESGEKVNAVSLSIGDYEDFKESALDPYVAMRDAYRQNRSKKIRDMVAGGEELYTKAPAEPLPWWQDEEDAVAGAGQAARTAATAPAQEQRAVASVFDNNQFFVEIAAAVSADQAVRTQHQLISMRRDFQVRVYNLGSSRYYGILVPAGATLAEAKREEQQIRAAGFAEARLMQ
ncbi:MAG: MlaA family lipoprotein [Thermodesulfobacteriota bacterium]